MAAQQQKQSRTGDVTETTGVAVDYVDQADPVKKETAESKSVLDSFDPFSAENRTRYANTSQADANTREVQADELSTTHLDRILAEDSPLRRRAMQAGIDFAASRGLANSSIAGGNAVGSLIDRAKDFATFDAAAYQTASRDNQTAENQIGMFNANSKNTTNMFNAGADNQYRDMRTGKLMDRESMREGFAENQNERDWKTAENVLGRDFDAFMQKNDQDFRTSIADLEARLQREGYDNQQRIAVLDAVARARADRANLLGQGIMSIYNNADMKAGEQNEAIGNLITTTNNTIFNDLVGDFPDLPDLFPELFGG